MSYTALRSLIVGHVAEVGYTLAIDLVHKARSRRSEKVAQRSLSGTYETLYFYGDDVWRLVFAPVNGSRLLALKEFLDSTEGGEPFQLALNGDLNPWITVKRTDAGYDCADFLNVGNDALDWFQTSIEVVQQ